ncbi:MAG: Glyceraldehyde-3-phosphate dehydrogenase [candidate division BRC1 bacterium ADurb.BinA364]|nr:MAG: Glyceraldehyde-3-phosphate dehydrogenase [candidate division BRC1 bacterium ADurb.BinA364]
MPVRIGINGFGRIGRLVFRAGLDNPNVEFVMVNDLGSVETMAHLLKYDSVHGVLDKEVKVVEGGFTVNGKLVKLASQKDPSALPWGENKVDFVVESTGIFRGKSTAGKHIAGGAKKVIVSAPGDADIDATFVMGVNNETYNPKAHDVVSNASCTTNCLAPVAKVINDNWKIKRGLMTTVHAYTNDQQLQDFPHKDLRRARAAAVSMIPSSTGAAKAIGLVLPDLNGKLDGFAIRVPTPNVSVVDLSCEVEKPATAAEINEACRKAAAGPLKNILAVADEPLVSIDFNHSPLSSTLDSEYTRVIDKTFVKILSWYDNEWGYSNRVIDLVLYMASKQ